MHSDFFLAFVTLFFAATAAAVVTAIVANEPARVFAARDGEVVLSEAQKSAVDRAFAPPPPIHPVVYRADLERTHRHLYVVLGMGTDWTPNALRLWRKSSLAAVEALVARQSRVYAAWAFPAQIISVPGMVTSGHYEAVRSAWRAARTVRGQLS